MRRGLSNGMSAGVVGLVLLTGCSQLPSSGTAVVRQSSSPAPDPGTVVKGALAKSLAARSAAVVIDTTVSAPNGSALQYRMTGRMRMDGLEGEFSGVLPAGAMAGVNAEVPIKYVMFHGTAYYHYDFPNGRSLWIKVDAGAKGAAAGGGDADAQLRALDAMRDVQRVGSEQVDGVGTNHYRGVMDSATTATLLENMGATSAPTVSMPVDVWVDDQGRLVRESMELDVDGTRTGTDMRFSGWGVAVKVTPPSGAIDIKDLQKSTQG